MLHRMIPVFLLLALITACTSTPVRQNSDVDLAVGRHARSPANVYIDLAVAYLNEGKLKVSLRNAEIAIDKDPDNPNAYNIMALVLQRLGQMEDAGRNFQRALRISPDDPYINNAYASYLCVSSRSDKARPFFEKAASHPLNRAPWVPLSNAGMCELKAGKLETAEEYFRKALQNNRNFPIALYNMIEVSLLKKNYLSARAYLQRYLEVGNHTAKTLWWGIKIENELGDRDKLDSYKLLLRAKFPDSDETRLLDTEKI